MPPSKARRAAQKHAEHAKRARQPKTPVAQLGSDAAYPDQDQDEEEVNEGAMEPSSDAPEEAEQEQIVLRLGSDIPDMQPTSQSARNVNIRDMSADEMGANQSHEEASKNIRNAAQQLQSGSRMVQPPKQKAGRLARPSSSAKVGAVRKLGRPNKVRKSVYDLEGSPEKVKLPPRPVADTTMFSPRRRERKASKAEAQAPPSPRRSGRAQRQKSEEHAALEAAQPADQLASVQANEGDAMYRDFFPDTVAQQYQAEPDAAVGAEDADNIVVAENHVEEDDEEPVRPAISGRKRGRPPKRAGKANLRSDSQSNLRLELETAPRPSKTPSAAKQRSKSQTPSSARARRRYFQLAQQNGTSEPSNETDQATASQEPAAQSPKRRSARLQRDLADLNRRRSAGSPMTNAESRTTASGKQKAAELEHEDEEYLPEKPIVLNPNELQLDDADGESEHSEESDAETGKASGSRKRKRKDSSRGTQANTSAKRTKKAQPVDQDDDQPDEEPDVEMRCQVKRLRLWGQWQPLMDIYQNLQYVGGNFEIVLEDNDVQMIDKLCAAAKRRYENLKNGPSDDMDSSEPASLLGDIARRVDGLRGRNEDFPTDFEDKTKITNIYSHLIPGLVRLVIRAMTCYEALDKDEVAPGEISTSHLRIVQGLIEMILDMEFDAAKRYKARPDTSDAVVKPVHNGIAVPLKKVGLVFQRRLQLHHLEMREMRRRQQEAQDRALRLEQEERRSRQAAELNQIRQKWEQLHRERMAAEGGMIRPAKMAHLRMPDPNLDIDADGLVFRRVSLFHPRVGPPPGLLDEAKKVIWTEGELRALTDGLREYSGRIVFERIFRAWCPRGRILNKYNVLEIVAAAENVKRYFEGVDGENAAEWVKTIPVWSSAPAAGEENEEKNFVDVDKVVGEGTADTATAGAA